MRPVGAAAKWGDGSPRRRSWGSGRRGVGRRRGHGGARGRRCGARPRPETKGAGQSVKTARLEHTRDASSQVTGWINRSRVFLAQVKNEMERVTWPTRKEVYATTLVVLLTSAFFGLYLSAIDVVLVRIARFLFDMFGAQ